MTKAEALRTLVIALDADDHTAAEIAAHVGITVTRVEVILDEHDADQGVPHTQWRRAPAIEPLERTPKKKGTPLKVTPQPVMVKKVSGPITPKPPGLTPINHGTSSGARQHRRRGEQPCDECRAAENAQRAASKRAKWQRENPGVPYPVKPPGPPRIHGTTGGWKGHLRRKEQPCDECRRASNLARADRKLRAREQAS